MVRVSRSPAATTSWSITADLSGHTGYLTVMPPTSSLCLDCGLCCDGTMHTTVALEPADDRAVLQGEGFRLLVFETEACFEQPCVAFHGSCTIYDHRPMKCSRYRCALLRQVDSGEVTDGEARALVADAIALRDRVRPAIEALAGTTRKHSLGVLVRKMEDALEALDPAQRLETQSSLELDVAALLTLLADRFEPRDSLPIVQSYPVETDGDPDVV